MWQQPRCPSLVKLTNFSLCLSTVTGLKSCRETADETQLFHMHPLDWDCTQSCDLSEQRIADIVGSRVESSFAVGFIIYLRASDLYWGRDTALLTNLKG